MRLLLALGAFGMLTGLPAIAKPEGSSQDAKWDAMGFDLSQAPAEVQRQAARDFQPELLAALRTMAAKGISLNERPNEEVDGTPLKPFVNPLSYLDVQPFLSVALPAVKDPGIPQRLSAQVLNRLICHWGGSYDSDGRSPVEQQLEIVDGLLPAFSETADKAIVSREALTRTGMESPMEAAEWLAAHPYWEGSAREKLVTEMLAPFYDIDPKPDAFALLKSLKATNYPKLALLSVAGSIFPRQSS